MFDQDLPEYLKLMYFKVSQTRFFLPVIGSYVCMKFFFSEINLKFSRCLDKNSHMQCMHACSFVHVCKLIRVEYRGLLGFFFLHSWAFGPAVTEILNPTFYSYFFFSFFLNEIMRGFVIVTTGHVNAVVVQTGLFVHR